MRKILVLGAAGKTGFAFLQCLAHSDAFYIESVIRDSKKIDRVDAFSDKVTCFEYANESALSSAMKDTDILYLALPRNDDEVKHATVIISLAKQYAVSHIIYISAMYDEQQTSVFSHSKKIIETMMQSIGCSYAIIRPNFFMSRFTYLPAVVCGDELQLISAVTHDSVVTFIDVDDIALFAVKSIAEPSMHNIVATLTGSQAYSMSDSVKSLSHYLHKNIVYVREDAAVYARRLAQSGYTPQRITQQLETFDLWSQGACEVYCSDYYDYMGQATSSFSSYIKRNLSHLNIWSSQV